MNAAIHSELSVKHYKGKSVDYYDLHDFMDSSKEVESTNRHRFLTHTMFFVKNVMIPIYGNTITNSSGVKVNVKDLLETDHIMADYKGRFIPTIMDFVDEIDQRECDDDILRDFQSDNSSFFREYSKIKEVMMLPFFITGNVRALFATHNSWFVGFILPKLFIDIKVELKNTLSPSYFFNKMEYKPWMQNGKGTPPSFEKIEKHRKVRVLEELQSNMPQPIVVERPPFSVRGALLD
jgi:hypothetical protein